MSIARGRGRGSGILGSTRPAAAGPGRGGSAAKVGSAGASAVVNAASAASDRVPATQEDMASIKRLCQQVARVFYDDSHVVVIDQLVGIPALASNFLAQRLCMTPKELAIRCAKLLEDNMVATHRRSETRDATAGRAFQRSYYYIDYALFLDSIKWRMMQMQRVTNEALNSELNNRGYVCPRCHAFYVALDAMRLLDPQTGSLRCDVLGCGTEVDDNEDAERVRDSRDRMARLNTQLEPILAALREADRFVLPHFDVGAWLVRNAAQPVWYPPNGANAVHLRFSATAANTTIALGPDGQPLSDQNTPSNAPGSGSSGVVVSVITDDPVVAAERAAQANAAAEASRQANALPGWHLASTISMEPTALGREEERRKAQGGAPIGDTQTAGDAGGDDDDDYYAQYAAQGEEEEMEEIIDTTNKNKRALEADGSAPSVNKKARTDAIVAEAEDEDLEEVV